MFWTQNFFCTQIFLALHFWTLNVVYSYFWSPHFWDLKFFGPKICLTNFLVKNVFGQKFFTTNIFLPYFLTYRFLFQLLLTPNFLPIFFLTQYFKIQYCFWGTKHLSYLKWEAKFQTNEKLNFKLNLYLQSNCLSLDWAPAQLQLVLYDNGE